MRLQWFILNLLKWQRSYLVYVMFEVNQAAETLLKFNVFHGTFFSLYEGC